MPKLTKKELIESEEKLNKKFSKIVDKLRNSFLEEMNENNFSLLERQYCATEIAKVFIDYNQYFFIRVKIECAQERKDKK